LVVTVFVTAQPAPKESLNSNRASTGNSPPNGGPKLTKFTIHKDFICFYSPFFASAFNGLYKEGQTQTMTLYEIEPEAFGMFVSWLYQRKLPTHTVEFEHVDLVHLVHLWILGDWFPIPSLQKNAVYRMHTVIHEGRSEFFGGFIDIAYKYREGHNELSKLAVWTVVLGNQAVFDEIWQESGFPPAMALGVMKVLKTHYEGLTEGKKLTMPPNDTFKVKEYRG
jgi:BTB/POZ domain